MHAHTSDSLARTCRDSRLKGVKSIFGAHRAGLGLVRVATGMCIAYASMVCKCCTSCSDANADKAQCMMNSPSSQYELFDLGRQQIVVATLEKKLRAMKVMRS